MVKHSNQQNVQIEIGNEKYPLLQNILVGALQDEVADNNNWKSQLIALMREYVYPLIFEFPDIFFIKYTLES